MPIIYHDVRHTQLLIIQVLYRRTRVVYHDYVDYSPMKQNEIYSKPISDHEKQLSA